MADHGAVSGTKALQLQEKASKLMKQSVSLDIAKIALAALIALIALSSSANIRIDLENLAKGKQNTARAESFNGQTYTAYTVKDIKALIDSRNANMGRNLSGPLRNRILWLGNSQLHYINQYQKGDHLSPYWLRSKWKDPAAIEPLGCSIPKAGFQEYLILSRYAVMKCHINLVILELVFDNLREDSLRDEFTEILSPETSDEMRKTSKLADDIITRFSHDTKGAEESGEKDVLSGTMQSSAEHWLNKTLSSEWNLWASRPQLEGNAYLALYYFRNYVFGIKPTTVRRTIRARYDENMDALRDILNDCRQRKIPVLLYIAPIRQDKPIPYDINDYTQWKKELAEMAQSFGADLVNLEQLVPANMWGTYHSEDIDFMHFQGPGHKLVAEALLPHVKKILEEDN